MRIDFECSGGFANLQLSYHANTENFSQAAIDSLEKLVESVDFFNLQQSDLNTAVSGPPDVISYQLSLADGARRNSISCNDVTAPATLHPLLSHLRQLAIEQKR